MKVSELWLREWVSPPISTQELVAQLTMAGLEVDNVAPVSGAFDQVVVAKVLETCPHPEADRLTICKVDCGKNDVLQIVCGASNVRPELMVALAMIGATLPNGMSIKETKLRGQLSQGMLCSSAELGLMDDSEGIIELPSDAPIGQDLREYMGLEDTVLDIDLTPNRADCFSILGIAREVATLNHIPLIERQSPHHQPIIDDRIHVQLPEPHACPQYYGRVIRQMNPNAMTPLWLIERLRRAGIRAIHPVVDVLNYVMIELGQPMHAFHLQAIEGDIQIRFSQQGEKLTLLDTQTVTLNEKTLIIADQTKPLAIAGIMGGFDSAVQADTTDIFLESAFFNPRLVAGVARQYGLCTESSQRYERGVDPSIQLRALEYATDLLLNIVGGQTGPIISAQDLTNLPPQKQIAFDPEQVSRLTGVFLSESAMISTLQGLGMMAETQTKPWTITVPPHRFDIELDVDLVEEIIRIYGYDNISAQPMVAPLQAGAVHFTHPVCERIRYFLNHRGYHEIISYSFVDPALQTAIYPEAQPLSLLNPISSELSQMRVGLWPGLVASYIYNSHRQQDQIKLFETGTVFDGSAERECIAGLLSGVWGEVNWSEPTRGLDFFDLKGDAQALLHLFDLGPIQFKPSQHPGLHPGKTAEIYRGERSIGWIGALHPRLVEALSFSQEILLFELTLDALLPNKASQYQKISKYPSVRRDLSFIIAHEVNAFQIETTVRDAISTDQLKAFDVFDVYSGEGIPAGKKSLAIALTFQDRSRTLLDEEINSYIDEIINKLRQDFDIILRDSL